MRLLTAAHTAIDHLAELPPILKLRKRRFDVAFAKRSQNSFRGVFDTFDDAARSAPAERPLGYDNPDAANMYVERRSTIYTTDYPALFWLRSLFARESIKRIFDLGGHVGVSYYSYRKMLTYPNDLRWVVHDVPAVMRRGQEIAISEDSFKQLSFAESFTEAAGADVLFASGSLQYLSWTIGAGLANIHTPPPHVIINMLPVHPQREYFTLQGIGTAFCPYRISSEPKLMDEMRSAGYELVDRWVNPDKRCEIAFTPEYSLDHYKGYYFSRK